ncbi:MAG: SMP-30/gluconolactonase/LRE family protein [Pseudomonadota bacterium]
MQVFDDRICALGEGPLWHPKRQELLWFDILGKRLLSKSQVWAFDEYVSAAGWVDDDTLVMASETALWRFDIRLGERERLVPLEADNPATRSNDGRADPSGGFWIGTMGRAAEPRAGAIYRYYRGELRQLFSDITVSNAICFSPDGAYAYFADTWTRRVMRQALDAEGWPKGEADEFLDLRSEGLNPDGAVVDAEGRVWNAQWGASRVACYEPDGIYLRSVEVPATQASCPAFGGPDLTTLFVTSAADGVDEGQGGMTFSIDLDVEGQAEHRVVL